MAAFKTSIKFDGVFFRHDPVKTFHGNVAQLLHDVVNEGLSDVKGQLQSGQNNRMEIAELGGRVADHVVAGMKRVTGKPPRAYVYVRNEGMSAKEGKSLMAAASNLEGRTHAFRKTAGRLKRASATQYAELLKGIV